MHGCYQSGFNASMWVSPQICTESFTEEDPHATQGHFPYHISFVTSDHQRATPEVPSVDLQNFFSWIFLVPQGLMFNGNFFAVTVPGFMDTLTSAPYRTFSKIDHIPNHKASLTW